MPTPLPVFDGHNDLLLRLLEAPDAREAIWLAGEGKGHLDLPRMKRGHFAGGFFAIYIPSPEAHDIADFQAMMETPPYDVPTFAIGLAAALVSTAFIGFLSGNSVK